MPEGDTIHRAADRMRPALVGRPLVRLELHHATGDGRRPPVGTLVDAVDAVGKHLLIRFANGSTLRTHLRMTGSWHLYRPGTRWRKPRHLARAVVEVDGWEAVCFAAPVVELTSDVRAETNVSHLGPDLTSASVTDDDLDRAVARLDQLVPPDAEIGAVLLDQSVAAGIGNVYKSEVLFLCGVEPFTPVASVSTADRRRLFATAARLLRANTISSGPRTTVEGGLAVYGRTSRPCRRCGTPIRSRRQGEQARMTYWCPACQPATVATR